jgi:hypothetical protein
MTFAEHVEVHAARTEADDLRAQLRQLRREHEIVCEARKALAQQLSAARCRIAFLEGWIGHKPQESTEGGQR